MNIFIDTAAFLAVMNAEDRYHQVAKRLWVEILSSEDTHLVCSNYVMIETVALIQHRFGLDALRLFVNDILPVTETIWVEDLIHRQAMSALLAANRRHLSLVDCTSFEIMRQYGLDAAFTFDSDFEEQGFKVIPESKE